MPLSLASAMARHRSTCDALFKRRAFRTSTKSMNVWWYVLSSCWFFCVSHFLPLILLSKVYFLLFTIFVNMFFCFPSHFVGDFRSLKVVEACYFWGSFVTCSWSEQVGRQWRSFLFPVGTGTESLFLQFCGEENKAVEEIREFWNFEWAPEKLKTGGLIERPQSFARERWIAPVSASPRTFLMAHPPWNRQFLRDQGPLCVRVVVDVSIPSRLCMPRRLVGLFYISTKKKEKLLDLEIHLFILFIHLLNIYLLCMYSLTHIL